MAHLGFCDSSVENFDVRPEEVSVEIPEETWLPLPPLSGVR